MNRGSIWITGAHGFIGRHVARSFADAGRAVIGIGHGAWPRLEAREWGVSHWLNGEIGSSNLTALKGLGGAPEVVVHLAGGSSVGSAIAQPREDFHRTVTSTIELFEWLRQESPATRVVAASTAAVYGTDHKGTIDEGAELKPYSPYGFHKLMMEGVCESYGATYGLRSVIARLFSVYGIGLKKQLLWDLCCKLLADVGRVELGGTGEEVRDWIGVNDVAGILCRMDPFASDDAPKINVGTGIGTTVRNIAQEVVCAWDGYMPTGKRFSFSGASRPGDPFSLVASTQRLAQHGFSFDANMVDGIRQYVSWFRRVHAPT